MMALPVLSGPGLKRKEMVEGREPQALSTLAIWVMSSRFRIAPISYAVWNSSSGVSLLVNMILSPGIPASLAIYSSGRDEQSAPKPWDARSFRILIFGRAFTAKKLVNSGAQEKAAFISSAFFSIASPS